jgi:hypothetical protein
MAWIEQAAAGAGSVILGTATPIQLQPAELWDLVHVLQQGAPHVLGRGATEWAKNDACIGYLSGDRPWPHDPLARWDLIKNPLAPASEDGVFRDIRRDAALPDAEVRGPLFTALSPDVKDELSRGFARFSAEHNPIIRRIVRRTRPMLESRGLLRTIAVKVHPVPADHLPERLFDGQGLSMGLAFKQAYNSAEDFCRLYARSHPASGFLKTILLRRVGSSPSAGLATARKLLESDGVDVPEAEQGDAEPDPVGDQSALSFDEKALLRLVIDNLAAVVATPDPKVEVVIEYLRDRDWLTTNGAILFSQYLTTADWVAEALTSVFPDEPVALYAGGAASFVMKAGERRSVSREQIKAAVQRGDIRLLVATDAACEGLNLQRLGSQFNLDLPWNPARLEQRKGRVQRIGQARDTVHVVNLRYAGTVEDSVYASLSARMNDIFAVVGQLPDGFEDAWVDAVLRDREAVRHFPQRFATLKPPMELRYARDVADDRGLDWESTTRVIADRDLDDFLRTPWREGRIPEASST